jgi:hypothetical protein
MLGLIRYSAAPSKHWISDQQKTLSAMTRLIDGFHVSIDLLS